MFASLNHAIRRAVFAQQEPRLAGAMPAPAELAIADDLIPLRRPQLRLDGESVFFLASQRPLTTLEVADVTLWNAIDGRRTVGDLAADFDDARARLSAMWRRELIELAEGKFPVDRTPILIVEPHMDDAVLSLGATMWARRHEAEMTVLTVSSISNYTSYHKLFRGLFDIHEITDLRRAEFETILRLLGGRLQTLDQVDAALRYHHANWTAEWFRENSKAVSAYVNYSLPAEAVENLAQKLVARFAATDARDSGFRWASGGAPTTNSPAMPAFARLSSIPGSSIECSSISIKRYPIWGSSRIIGAASSPR